MIGEFLAAVAHLRTGEERRGRLQSLRTASENIVALGKVAGNHDHLLVVEVGMALGNQLTESSWVVVDPLGCQRMLGAAVLVIVLVNRALLNVLS